MLYRALVNFLLLPWPSFIVNHRMDLRKQHLSTFLLGFTAELRRLNIHTLADDKAVQESCKLNKYMDFYRFMSNFSTRVTHPTCQKIISLDLFDI